MSSSTSRHWQRSLGDILAILSRWVQSRPAWLRPALYGALLIYGFVIWRGGLIILPIAIPILFFLDRALLGRLLLAIFILAPAGGFAGGLVWGTLSPLLARLGKAGRVLKFVVGTWVYAAVLVFVIIPTIEPGKHMSPALAWGFIGGWGLFMGIAMGLQADKDAA